MPDLQNRIPSPGAMLAIALAVVSLAAPGHAAQDSANPLIAASVGHPDRSAEDRARDAGRKPMDVMTFFDIREGDAVIEIGAGAGYYTELLSRAVGEQGFVFAYNPFFFLNQIAEALKPRYADGALDNVVLSFGSLTRARLPAESFDGAYFITTYHDIHYDASTGDAISPAARASLAEIYRIMKPGATLGLVDHRAADGLSRAEAASAHRIAEDVLMSDMLLAGFEFVARSDMLSNSDDPGTAAFFDEPALRGRTDRVVYAFRKPR